MLFTIGGAGVDGMRPTTTWWTMARREEVWELWKAGECAMDIARALKKRSGSIHMVLRANGGIAPPRRRRSRWALSLPEREEISRGLAARESMRAIARRLGRSASTISREVGRNGGRMSYRATKAEERAWKKALRPKACLLAVNRRLREVVEEKLIEHCSPQQISGWLLRSYPEGEAMYVSAETIYRALFVQSRGALKKELLAHLRSGRTMCHPKNASKARPRRGQIEDAVSIRERPRGP